MAVPVSYIPHRSAPVVPEEKSTHEYSMPGPMRPARVSEAPVTLQPWGSSMARESFQGCAPKVRSAEAAPEEKVVRVTGVAVAPGEERRGARRRTVARRSGMSLRGEDDVPTTGYA